MTLEKMTIPQMKDKLQEIGVDYSKAKSKSDFEKLINDNVDNSQSDSVVDTVKNAIVKDDEMTESKPSKRVTRLSQVPYGQLTRGERLLLREKSPEYSNVTNGISVKVTSRNTLSKQIHKISNGTYAHFLTGGSYILSEDDYNVLKDVTIKVKTKETEKMCCGRAKWEKVPLLVRNDE